MGVWQQTKRRMLMAAADLIRVSRPDDDETSIELEAIAHRIAEIVGILGITAGSARGKARGGGIEDRVAILAATACHDGKHRAPPSRHPGLNEPLTRGRRA